MTVRPLSSNEGLTIAIAMPKGSILPPSDAQQRGWFWRDNINFILGGGGLGLVLIYYFWFWRRVGRDPPRGIVVPRWHPRKVCLRRLSTMSITRAFPAKAGMRFPPVSSIWQLAAMWLWKT